MKKMHIFKALFAATALALALPSCSDIGEESTIQPQAIQAVKEGKIPVSLSVKEEFRTIISAVDTNDLAYTLVITDTADSTAADYEAPKTIELTDLTGTVAYLTPEKTYSFALTGYAKDTDEKATDTAVVATPSPVEKKITAANATVSLVLQAVTDATVQVTLPVTYGTGYGVSDVTATVYDDSALTVAATDMLALDSENAKNTDKTDGEVEFTGTIATGATKWVKIELKDGTKTIGGKTVALYGIPTGDIEAESVEATVKEYKATVNLTADTKPESLTLKNPAVTTAGYTGISVTTESTANPYEFSAYVPVGTYDVYNGETLLGQVATSTTPLTVDTSITLTKITAAWTTSQPTLYVGGEGNEDAIKAALTVTATLSTGDEAVTNYTLNFDNTTAGEQTATISYTYNGKTETATVTLTLTAVELESIAVDGEASAKETDGEGNARTPLNLNYTTNDSEIDLTGLVLKLTNNDGSTSSVAYSGDNITKTGYFEDNSGVPGTVISDEATIFASAHTCWVQVTYSEKTAMYKVTVEKGVTYVVEGKYNLTTSAKAGYTVDGNENGKWDAQAYDQNNNPTQTHDGITITGAVTSNGFDSHGKNSPGTITFALNSAMYLTFADSNNKGVTIKSTDGGSVDGTVGGKDAVVGASSKPSTFLLTAGSYTMASTTAGSTRIATLEFNSLATTWANAKASAGTAAEYWTGWDAISTALSATPSTDDEYLAAISDLQSAINAAVKYVAPTAITVTYADTPVENGAELSFSKASGNTLTLTAKENEGSTGSLTWTVEGIEGISKEVSVADDGISTCVISGITEIGTINVKVEDTRASLNKAFTITVTANVVKVEAEDVIDVTVSATNAIMDETLELTATPAKSYSEAVTYQWYKNGKELENATTPTLSYTTKDGDAGSLVFTFKVSGADATATGTASAVTVKNLYKFDFENDTNTSYAIDANIFSTSTKLFTLVAKEKLVNIETDKSPATAEDSSGYIFTKAAVGGNSSSYLSLTAAHNGKVTIYFTSTDSSFASKDQAKSAKIQIDGNDVALSTTGNLSNTTAYVYSWNIEKGTTYKVDNNGSNRLALFGVTFEPAAPTNTTISVSHDIPTNDIALVVSGQTATVTLPEGVSETGNLVSYEWLVDGYVQSNQNTASYTLTNENNEHDIAVGDSYVVTARVTIDGIVYTKTASVLYIGN